MTDNASIVEEIVRCLSFEVLAIPDQSQKLVPSTTTKATPLNIKVKVKKKHEGVLQHGVLATPVKGLDEVPQRIRLVSSDQTIMSFNAVMEDIGFDKSRVRKPLQNIDNHSHTLSITEACQSAGTLKNKYLLAKVANDSKKKKDIFGTCKPGGCLDPPFGEDKYSYEPSKQKQSTQIQDTPEKKRTSSIFSNKLFNKIKRPKTNKVDVKKGETESYQSLTSLFQTGSLQTSNSIITYPSLLNESNDKVIQDRQKSPRNSATRKSTLSDNGSLFIVPKKIRASLEKVETKQKSEKDDMNLDSTKELGIVDVRKFDEDERVNLSSLKYLEKGEAKYLNADTVHQTNYQETNIFHTEPKVEKCLSDNLVDNALEAEQDETTNSTTSKIKTDVISGVAAATPGTAATLLTDLKTSDCHKTSDDDDTNVDSTKELENVDDVRKSNEDDRVDSSSLKYLEKINDNALESEQDEITDNATSRIKTGLIAGVAAATAGIGVTLLADLKDSHKTSDDTSVDMLSDYDNEDLKVGDNDINKTILNDNEDKVKQSATKNITRVKVEQGGNVDNGEQLSTNTIDYVNSDANKESLSPKDIEIISNKDLSKVARSNITKADLKDSHKTTNDTSVDKLSDNDNEDLKVGDNDINKTILNDNENKIKQSATKNITGVKIEQGSNADDGEKLSTNKTDANKFEGLICEDNEIISNKDLSKVAQSNVNEADIKDCYKTSNGYSIDKPSDNDNEDLKVGDNDTNKTILNNNRDNNRESDIENITDVKTEHSSNVDDGEQLPTNAIDNNNSDASKSEGFADRKIVSDIDLSKIATGDGTEDDISDTKYLVNEIENLDSFKLVSADHDSINKLVIDDLSENQEFSQLNSDSNEESDPDNNVSQDRDNINKISTDDLIANRNIDYELVGLDTLDKQVSKNDIANETIYPKADEFTDPIAKDERESDSEPQSLSTSDIHIEESKKDNQNIISIRGDNTFKNNEDILPAIYEQIDFKDMLQKGKEVIELGKTHGNDKTQSGLKKNHAADYENIEMKQSINVINNDEQSDISSDVIHKIISSDKLENEDDLSGNISKHYKLQPRSNSKSESLKEVNFIKAADKGSIKQYKTKIDLGLHTYINENNELVIKSFDSKTTPIRYPRDSIIVTACDLKVPFELKVPFDSEQYLSIQIKDNENLTKILPGNAISSKNSIIHKKQIPKLNKINEEMNSTVKNATKAVKLINKGIVKAQMKDIYGTYENELIPLQKSLTRLKQDVDVLILHQKTIRNNLLAKRSIIQRNRKCGCVKKL